jgi:hypothetical protein
MKVQPNLDFSFQGLWDLISGRQDHSKVQFSPTLRLIKKIYIKNLQWKVDYQHTILMEEKFLKKS